MEIVKSDTVSTSIHYSLLNSVQTILIICKKLLQSAPHLPYASTASYIPLVIAIYAQPSTPLPPLIENAFSSPRLLWVTSTPLFQDESILAGAINASVLATADGFANSAMIIIVPTLQLGHRARSFPLTSLIIA